VGAAFSRTLDFGPEGPVIAVPPSRKPIITGRVWFDTRQALAHVGQDVGPSVPASTIIRRLG
jgi:hypothetical protein